MKWSIALWIWLISAVANADVENFTLVGIGAVLSSEAGYANIRELVPGGPAAKDGQLKVGDRVTAVAQGDGEFVDTVDMKLDKVVEMIRGKKDTVVRLQVIPVDAADPSVRKVIKIRRDEIKLKEQEARAEIIERPGLNVQQPSAAPPASATLRWRNGEIIPGELVEASAADVTWKTPLFEDPLVLGWHALRRIYQPLPPVPVTDPFSIALRDGSHIHGELVSVTEKSVSIHSARHGDAVLKRSEVLSVRRLRGGGVIFAGPAGDVGWDILANRKNVPSAKKGSAPPSAIPSLAVGPGGVLLLPYWNGGAFLDLTLPELVDVEFRVRSSTRPDFQLWLEGGYDQRVRLETWDDELVLAASDQFKAIRKIAENERDVGLRVCWDRKTRHCSVFSAAGELIIEWQLPEYPGNSSVGLLPQIKARDLSLESAAELITLQQLPGDPPRSSSGLVLQNKGRDLSLEFLRVRAWDGKPPPKIDVKQPRIELADGRIIEGQISDGSADVIKLRARTQDSELSFPIGEVDAMVFSTDPPEVSEQEATLSYADGTLLMGRISSVKEGRATLEISFAEEPLTSRMDALRQLLIKVPTPEGMTPEPSLAELDKIVIQKSTLRGKLTGAGEDQPRWLAVGGVRPAVLSKTFAGEISRALPPDAQLPSTPALFYTSAGDVLPGDLRALDRSGVEFQSSIIETTKLPAHTLLAIEFGSEDRTYSEKLLQTGAEIEVEWGDKWWPAKVLKKEGNRTLICYVGYGSEWDEWVPQERMRSLKSGQMNLEGFSNPGWRILKGDEKSVRKKNHSIELDPETAIGHPAAMQSSEIKFSLAPPASGFSSVRLRLFCAGTDGAKSSNLMLAYWGNRVQSGLESNEGQLDQQFQTLVPAGEPVAVRLVVQDKQVELHLNDGLIRKFSLDPAKRAGAGLIIEPASMWGNPVNAIALSGFSARVAPGRTWLPNVSNETKAQALTVPRFRKDDPPRHALLAVNGDVLRGEIEAATASHFGFRSGLENLRVPRERVKAAIWLKKPEGDAPPPARENPALKRLDQRLERRISYSSAGLSTLIGVLQGEAGDLKFKLPEKTDTRTFRMQFGVQTIGEALDQICSLFGLRYSVDNDGTIVLEAASQPSTDLVQKVYWLKTVAFPSVASVQQLLTGKGIPFPKGAAALWQPDFKQLSMTNTVPNHGKLAAALDADFGGSLGSPTHWLLLTSGARFGLTVDKFEQDFISGYHPVYGRCKVPMSDVYVIRTSMPEPTPAMKSLADWRLAFAPEPVLPETGGESSPMLGKEAKTFKLPLLGGGDFDLGQEKGKVVVLDFWATWCGPCIKSLPGLISAMSEFPTDRVKLIGVNQSEPAEQVKRFLETRDWKLTVAMDAGQSVARQYGVDGIPHTVIVGPDGKVAWVKTGYSPEGETEAANAVKQLLAVPSGIEPPTKGSLP